VVSHAPAPVGVPISVLKYLIQLPCVDAGDLAEIPTQAKIPEVLEGARVERELESRRTMRASCRPRWTFAAGLSPSDLRWRTETSAWLVSGGAETGAGGQLAVKRIGATDATNPNWWTHPRRYTVPVHLVHAGRNVLTVRIWDQYGGGGFASPADEMTLKPAGKPAPGFYDPDYGADFIAGDDPFRYQRW